MFVLISDLHWGAGDALEDFLLWGSSPRGPASRARAAAALAEEFARFLETMTRLASDAGLQPTLVLLGDTFDLWQAALPRERPARTLERILNAHTSELCALRQWIGSGGAIELVIGNHDQPLVDAEAWALFAEVMPGVNRSHGGAPAHFFRDEGAGLYAEHGHQWDPHNRVRDLSRPNATNTGWHVVRRLVNPLEPHLPWIDKAETVAETVRLAQAELHGEALREFHGRVERVLRGAPAARRVLAPWSKGEAADWRRMAERELRAMERGIREALSPRPRGTIGRPPAAWRFLVSGHTHTPLRVQTRRGPERLNTGTWRPVVLASDEGPVEVVQPLSYVLILPEDNGAWSASLRKWEVRGAVQRRAVLSSSTRS